MWKTELENQKQIRRRLANKVYKLTCTSCSQFFSKSPEVKKVYSNYMVFDPSVWSNFLVESRRKTNKYLSEETQPLSVLKCVGCKSDVGKAYKIRGVYLPQLNVKDVTFAPDNHDEGTATKMKWSAVEMDLFFIGEHDFESMLNALSNTEANMDKKRILDCDSKQHIRDIELKKYRIHEDEDKAKEARARKAAEEANQERPIHGGTEFSEDED